MTKNTSLECGRCGSRDITYGAVDGFKCTNCGASDKNFWTEHDMETDDAGH